MFDRWRMILAGGSKKLLPNEYKQVNYLESTGTQYITLGNLQYSKVEIIAVGQKSIFGGGVWGAYRIIDLTTDNRAYMESMASNSSAISNAAIVVNVGGDNYVCYETSTTGSTLTSSIATGSYTANAGYASNGVAIFGGQVYESVANSFIGKLYNFKLYSTGGTLAMDMYPCYRKTDNVAGLYDIVSNTFYTNDGTGSFIVG